MSGLSFFFLFIFLTSFDFCSVLNCSSALNDYIQAVRTMACEILELMAEGLNIGPRNVFSKFLLDEQSDSLFRLNHYPPCPELQGLSEHSDRNVVGFGEHTDPQIISILRSNNTSGLQILGDGTWISVPPDQYSFFINVGDSLKVLLLCSSKILTFL